MSTTATGLLERTETLETTGPGSLAHIVAPSEDKTSQALVMEARVYGTEVEALCGYRWVPSRDATKLPLCDKCKDILNGIIGRDDASDEVTQ